MTSKTYAITLLLLAAGCGVLQSGTSSSQAIKWANIGVATIQCSQDAAVSSAPEAGVQACIVKWIPNGDKVLSSPAWSSTASCVRLVLGTATGVDPKKAKAQGVTNCLQENMSALVTAAEAIAAK